MGIRGILGSPRKSRIPSVRVDYGIISLARKLELSSALRAGSDNG